MIISDPGVPEQDAERDEQGKESNMQEILDPWTTGLLRDYPAIYYRLEKFLNELAVISGRPRKAERLKTNGSTYLSVLRNDKRYNFQGMSVSQINDFRNHRDFERLLNGEITIEQLQEERCMSTRYAMISALDKTMRKDPPEQYKQFCEWRLKQRLFTKENRAKKREAKAREAESEE